MYFFMLIDSRALSLVRWQVDYTQVLPPSNGRKERDTFEMDRDSADEVRKFIIPCRTSNYNWELGLER
jgi:hypothetical protein